MVLVRQAKPTRLRPKRWFRPRYHRTPQSQNTPDIEKPAYTPISSRRPSIHGSG
jgi:hypothetical protein